MSIEYISRAKVEIVAEMYRMLTSIEALENSESAVWLPDSPSDAALTAAGYILAGTSGNAMLHYDNMEISLASDISQLESKKYGIYAALLGELPPKLSQMLTGEQISAAESGGLIALADMKGSKILVVTAKEPEHLVAAGRLFGNSEYMMQAIAPWCRVLDGGITALASKDEGAVQKLAEDGAYIHGPFRQEQSFFISGHSNRVLKPGSKVDLFFRYSQNLDFSRSLVTVYIDGTPVGSKKLSRELANGDMASFDLPANIQVNNSLDITVAFDLEIKDLECTLRQNEMPWAYVTPDSSATIYSQEPEHLLFEYYPGPFVSGGSLNDVAVVLPQSMGKADIEAMGKILLTMGRYLSDNSGNLRVCTEENLGDIADENLIAIGRYEKNLLARHINDHLFFRFSQDGSTIDSNEKTMIEPGYGATLGSGQLLYSPYSSGGKAMLMISGVTDEGMLQAAGYLGREGDLWRLYGDGFIADADNAHFYRFKPENAKAGSMPERLLSTPQALYAAIAVAAVSLLLFATVLILAMALRKRGKHEAK